MVAQHDKIKPKRLLHNLLMLNISLSIQLQGETNISMKDFLIEVSKGNVPGHSIIHKFGQNNAVGAFGFVDSTKITNLLFFKREGITKASAPYDAMRIVFEERSEGGQFNINVEAPIELGTGCDCGFMAKVNTGTAEVEVDFELLLIDNNYI